MGGGDSTLKGSSRVKDDVIQFFESELKQWNDIIKNLKESSKNPENKDWVPIYLCQQMEQTETKWSNVKALIQSQHGKSGLKEGTCNIKRHQDFEDNIKQLQTNNDQNIEAEMEKQRHKINEYEICLRQVKDALTDKEGIGSSKPSTVTNFKERQETSSNIHSLEIIDAIAKLNDKVAELEEKAKKQEEDRDRVETENDKLKQQVKELKEQRDKLNKKNNEREMDSNNAKHGIDKSMDKQGASVNVQGSEKCETIPILRTDAELEQKAKQQMEEIDNIKAENNQLKQKVKELEELRDKPNERKGKMEMDIKNETDKSKDHNQCGYQRQEVTKAETGELQKQIKEMRTSFEREKRTLLEENQLLLAKNESLETHANDLQKEKDVLLLRLSKIAGDRLVNNNDAIADLSDPNRPTKLGEFYSEIYDNEWTDAFDALKESGYGEEDAIETLRMTLENVVQFCERKAALVIHKSADAVNLLFEDYRKSVIAKEMPSHLTMPRKRAHGYGKLVQQNSSLEDIKLQQRWKPKETKRVRGNDSPRLEKVTTKENPNIDVDHKLRQLRKEMATYMIPIVQKAYIEACWTNECIEALKPFILKCIYLGWMMVVQSPPMALHRCHDDQEIKFEKNIHREYTTSGPFVRYIVWPALLLKENGAVVCKGVAEGKKKGNA